MATRVRTTHYADMTLAALHDVLHENWPDIRTALEGDGEMPPESRERKIGDLVDLVDAIDSHLVGLT